MLTGFFWATVFAAMLVALLWTVQSDRESKAKPAREAQENYHKALEYLKQNPADPIAHESALAWGREYARRARIVQATGSLVSRPGRVTVFDEVALSNDIAAACAAAGTPGEPDSLHPPLEDRLATLDHLRSTGAITQDEYECQRVRLLKGI